MTTPKTMAGDLCEAIEAQIEAERAAADRLSWMQEVDRKAARLRQRWGADPTAAKLARALGNRLGELMDPPGGAVPVLFAAAAHQKVWAELAVLRDRQPSPLPQEPASDVAPVDDPYAARDAWKE